MNTNLRRSQRYNDFIQVSVIARNETNESREIGPYAGRVINISRHGVCLLISLGTIESYDVYRSTCNNNTMYLEIEGNTAQENNKFMLSGRPVWVDPFILDDLRAFKMGIEFNSKTISQQTDDFIEDITAAATDSTLKHCGEK